MTAETILGIYLAACADRLSTLRILVVNIEKIRINEDFTTLIETDIAWNKESNIFRNKLFTAFQSGLIIC